MELVIYIALAKNCRETNLGKFKSDKNYFAGLIRKSWKPQKTIATVWKLFSWRAHSEWGFSEGVQQFVWCTIFLFKWSMKNHRLAKDLLAVSEIFLHENNHNCNSFRFSYKFIGILFCPFLENKNNNQVFSKLVDW